MSQPQSTARRQLDFLKRQLWVIVLVVAVALAIAAAATARQHKVYRAQSRIFVGSSGTLNPNFGNVIQPFTQTMSSLLTTDIVARKVVQNLGLTETPSQVLRNLHVSSTPENAVLQVSYDANNPRRAALILGEVGTVFTALVKNKLGHPTGPNEPVVTAKVWDPAHASSQPVSPHPVRTLAFAGVLALGLGIVLGLLRDTLDERIRRRDEMEELFGAPIMAVVPANTLRRPLIDPATGVDLARLHAVDPLRLQLVREGSQEELITVTSGGPRDGHSAVAASISVALALAGEHVICVDVSPQQKRSLSYYLNATASESAERRIAGPGDIDGALREVTLETVRERAGIEAVPAYLEDRSRDSVHDRPAVVAHSEGGRLELLQLGEGALSGGDGFSSWSIADLAEELKSHAARVVVDAPALPSAETFAVLSVSDGAIAVAREGRTTKEQATRVRNALETLQIGGYVLVSIGQASVPVAPYGRARSEPAHPLSTKRARSSRRNRRAR